MQDGFGKKKGVNGSAVDSTNSLGFLLKPTYQYVLSYVKTVHPEHKTLAIAIEAPGYLTYDARRVQTISARFGGRVEHLYVRYTFQPVRKGQHLLDLYSPEIVTAQQDLIFLLENDPGNATLIENARRRLLLLGLNPEQIRELETSRKTNLALPVYSPFDGLVIEKNKPAPVPAATKMGDKMETDAIQFAPAMAPGSDELSLREGMYVQKGQRLFSLQSLATVWAILEFYPSDAALVKVGQHVNLQIEPLEKPFLRKISYVEPQFGQDGKNLRARVYLDNPGGKLKPGALLRATVQAGRRSGLWIPRAAALEFGRQHVVFLKTGGIFQTRNIETGLRAGDWLEVLSGISPEDEIAADAQFLMDSESFVKSN